MATGAATSMLLLGRKPSDDEGEEDKFPAAKKRKTSSAASPLGEPGSRGPTSRAEAVPAEAVSDSAHLALTEDCATMYSLLRRQHDGDSQRPAALLSVRARSLNAAGRLVAALTAVGEHSTAIVRFEAYFDDGYPGGFATFGEVVGCAGFAADVATLEAPSAAAAGQPRRLDASLQRLAAHLVMEDLPSLPALPPPSSTQ